MKFWPSFLLIFLHQQAIIKATLFRFLVEDPNIFEDCEDETGYLGVADIFDTSDLQIDIFDESVHMEGSITMVWDVDPDNRVELRADVYKYERGTWQPTVFTLIQPDFCRTLFDENDIFYKSWAKFLEPDDMKCLTNKGHTYHHIPFDLETVLDIQGEDVSGRHKVVIKFDAYNADNEKQDNSACVEIIGDVIKIK